MCVWGGTLSLWISEEMCSEVNSNEYKMTGNILIAFKLEKKKKIKVEMKQF